MTENLTYVCEDEYKENVLREESMSNFLDLGLSWQCIWFLKYRPWGKGVLRCLWVKGEGCHVVGGWHYVDAHYKNLTSFSSLRSLE